ncbi:MAG: septum formation protein Maf [Chloroflexi bacterium]|nr:septum formation protein Maf [Chloroflexota bacterium]
MNLILASSSPRRREILSYLSIPFEVCSAPVDETPRPHEPPREMVMRLSRLKAEAAMRSCPAADTLVLAADTTVALDGENIGKPTDGAEARAMLKRLRGRAHQVFTAVTFAPAPFDARGLWVALCETRVHMRPYADADIEDYLATGEPFDKAGAYAIQDSAFHPVERIEGCYLNVMGLPLCEVIRGLQGFNAANGAREPALHGCLSADGQPCIHS